MKFLKLSLIAAALATLLATQTSAIITPYGELTSKTTIYGGDHALTTTTWRPINEDYLLIPPDIKHKEHEYYPVCFNNAYYVPPFLPPTNDGETYMWRQSYRIDGWAKLVYTIIEKHERKNYHLKALIRYWIGGTTVYQHTPTATYHCATRKLTTVAKIDGDWTSRIGDYANVEYVRLCDLYYPVVTNENGDVIPDVDGYSTNDKYNHTVTTIYKNVDIDPTVQYYITPAAKDDHIQCAPPIPVTINFTNSAG
ncbi:MAG: hypothetical protein LBJ95_00005 [Oscillospiraceae bacterium]|jgi:hypothetical protein|nr:hypothetical protein [Oscillospiraceae bacterium]